MSQRWNLNLPARVSERKKKKKQKRPPPHPQRRVCIHTHGALQLKADGSAQRQLLCTQTPKGEDCHPVSEHAALLPHLPHLRHSELPIFLLHTTEYLYGDPEH